MKLFQQRKNKRFNYVPRHLRGSEDDVTTQWNSLRRKSKHQGKSINRLVLLLVILGMIIAVWYLLTYYESR